MKVYKVKVNGKVNETAVFSSVDERVDRNGNAMAFVKLRINSCNIDGVIFASAYRKCLGAFDFALNPYRMIQITGKKDEKGKLIVSGASIIQKEKEEN